jgi:hypothetical protein
MFFYKCLSYWAIIITILFCFQTTFIAFKKFKNRIIISIINFILLSNSAYIWNHYFYSTPKAQKYFATQKQDPIRNEYDKFKKNIYPIKTLPVSTIIYNRDSAHLDTAYFNHFIDSVIFINNDTLYMNRILLNTLFINTTDTFKNPYKDSVIENIRRIDSMCETLNYDMNKVLCKSTLELHQKILKLCEPIAVSEIPSNLIYTYNVTYTNNVTRDSLNGEIKAINSFVISRSAIIEHFLNVSNYYQEFVKAEMPSNYMGYVEQVVTFPLRKLIYTLNLLIGVKLPFYLVPGLMPIVSL